MKTTIWMNLRDYIDLTIQLNELGGKNARLGDRRQQMASEQMRLRHSELETLIRESCEDWAEEKWNG